MSNITGKQKIKGYAVATQSLEGSLTQGNIKLILENAAEENQLLSVASVDDNGKPLSFKAIDKPEDINAATRTTLGGIIVGDNLNITEEGVLTVKTAAKVEEDNTLPITSAAVAVQVGNIEALLSTI